MYKITDDIFTAFTLEKNCSKNEQIGLLKSFIKATQISLFLVDA